ncbi:hypothetical protein GCM10009416_33130 [Craurococcus roseus]|uniref:Uncharacterized protein n=2 Tax=Craurococcus roseus TaxID=77585 RepID=A0ABP3QJQ7_9PROT
MLMRCNPLGLPMAMAGTAMGGMAAMAAVGPFLAGLGVGAALVGGSILARKAMERRNSWRDDDGMGSSTMGAGMSDLGPGGDPTSPTAPPL